LVNQLPRRCLNGLAPLNYENFSRAFLLLCERNSAQFGKKHLLEQVRTLRLKLHSKPEVRGLPRKNSQTPLHVERLLPEPVLYEESVAWHLAWRLIPSWLQPLLEWPLIKKI
jgi:hypothetical protein